MQEREGPGVRERKKGLSTMMKWLLSFTSESCRSYCFLGITGALESVKEMRLGEPQVKRLVHSGWVLNKCQFRKKELCLSMIPCSQQRAVKVMLC